MRIQNQKMSPLLIVLIAKCFILSTILVAKADECPTSMPLRIGKYCYHFQTDLLRFDDALDNCRKLEDGGELTSYKFNPVLEKLKGLINELVLSKLEKASWWIGIAMNDESLWKAAEDRTWKTDYDESEWVQKDYKMWETEGGPTNKGLTCAVINGSNDFKVKAVDCGGPRAPYICMMEEGRSCKHGVLPYLTYGPHCIAVMKEPIDYNKLLGACNPGISTPFKDDEMKQWVAMAARNSFLGGGLYMNMRKIGDKFFDMSDGSIPSDGMWEDGEPRAEYDCVGLSLQNDNSLKLKTMNCAFLASSLCVVERM